MKPDDAWWDSQQALWIHGAKDEHARLVGEVRYWNADGALISTAHYVAGVLHGTRRFFRGTGAPRHLTGADERVVTYERVYDHGDLIGTAWRDRDGGEVERDGEPLPTRPATVEPTASLGLRGWVFVRYRGEGDGGIVVRREYSVTGHLRAEITGEGVERSYDHNGILLTERRGDRLMSFDPSGVLRCVSQIRDHYEVHRTWYRTAVEANGGALVREGPVEENLEVGAWTVGDERVDLGALITDEELLAHPVSGHDYEELPDGLGIVATLARVRKAGVTGDASLLRGPTPWHEPDVSGPRAPHGELVRRLAAMRWNLADGKRLAKLAALLFRAGHDQAAIDVIEATLLLGRDPQWVSARAAYLRASGRGVDVPTTLDARARGLLDEIHTHPDDDAPRLVFADHIASAFPEHTALIVAQCAGREDAAILDAFRATLPLWLAERRPVRGFLDFAKAAASHLVETDPELLDRVAPACRELEVHHARSCFARLVMVPWLRRLRSFSFAMEPLADEVVALARSPHLDDLEHLGLCRTQLGDDELRVLCTSSAFPRLRSIDLGGYEKLNMHYTLDGLRALVDAPFAPTLRTLVMPKMWLGDGVVEILAKLPALVELDLTGGALTDRGARALLDLPNPWTSLALGKNELGESTKQALVAKLGERVQLTSW